MKCFFTFLAVVGLAGISTAQLVYSHPLGSSPSYCASKDELLTVATPSGIIYSWKLNTSSYWEGTGIAYGHEPEISDDGSRYSYLAWNDWLMVRERNASNAVLYIGLSNAYGSIVYNCGWIKGTHDLLVIRYEHHGLGSRICRINTDTGVETIERVSQAQYTGADMLLSGNPNYAVYTWGKSGVSPQYSWLHFWTKELCVKRLGWMTRPKMETDISGRVMYSLSRGAAFPSEVYIYEKHLPNPLPLRCPNGQPAQGGGCWGRKEWTFLSDGETVFRVPRS